MDSTTNNDLPSPTQNFQQGRKFRIATDWSDTGPTSMPVNETIDNNGEQSSLFKWF